MGEVLQLSARSPVKVPSAEVRARILELLPGTLTELSNRTGRPPSDRTLRTRLASLESEGLIRKDGRTFRHAEPTRQAATSPVEMPPGFEAYVFPPHLDDDSRALLAVKLVEYEFIEWTSSAVELLESYIGALQTSRNAHAAVSTAGNFVIAESGRVYAHPGVAVAGRADRDAQGYREALAKLDDKGGGGLGDEQPPLF
jgi:hypothetical protein